MYCCYCNHVHYMIHYTHTWYCCYCHQYTTWSTTHIPGIVAIATSTLHDPLHTYLVLLLLPPVHYMIHCTHTWYCCYCHQYTTWSTTHTPGIVAIATSTLHDPLHTYLVLLLLPSVHYMIHYTHTWYCCYCHQYTTWSTTHIPGIVAIVTSTLHDSLHTYLVLLLLQLVHYMIHYTHTWYCCYCNHVHYVVHCTHTWYCCFCNQHYMIHYTHTWYCCYCHQYTTWSTTHIPGIVAIATTTLHDPPHTYLVLLLLQPVHYMIHCTHTWYCCYCHQYTTWFTTHIPGIVAIATSTLHDPLHTYLVLLLLPPVHYMIHCTHTWYCCYCHQYTTWSTTHIPGIVAIATSTLHDPLHTYLVLLLLPPVHYMIHCTHTWYCCYCHQYTTWSTTHIPGIVAIVTSTLHDPLHTYLVLLLLPPVHYMIHYTHTWYCCYCHQYTTWSTAHIPGIVAIATSTLHDPLHTYLVLLLLPPVHYMIHYTHTWYCCYCHQYTTWSTTHIPGIVAIATSTLHDPLHTYLVLLLLPPVHYMIHYTHTWYCCYCHQYTTWSTAHIPGIVAIVTSTLHDPLHTYLVLLLLPPVHYMIHCTHTWYCCYCHQYTTWSTAHIPGIVAIATSTLHGPLHTYLVLLLLPPVHYMIHYTHTWDCCYCHQYTTWSTTHIPGIVAIATSTLHDPLHTYLVLLLLPPVHYMIHYTHTWYCCYCHQYTTWSTTHIPGIVAIATSTLHDPLHTHLVLLLLPPVHYMIHCTHTWYCCYCHQYTTWSTAHTPGIVAIATSTLHGPLHTHLVLLLLPPVHYMIHYTHTWYCCYCHQYTTWSTTHTPGIVAIATSTLHEPLHTYLVLLLLSPVHYMIHYTHTWYCCYCHQYTTWSTAHTPGIVAIATSTLHDPLHTYLVLLLLPPVHYMIHCTHTWYCCYCHQYTTWSTTHIPGIVAIATSTLHDPLHTYLVLLLLPPVHYMIHYTHTWYCCYCHQYTTWSTAQIPGIVAIATSTLHDPLHTYLVLLLLPPVHYMIHYTHTWYCCYCHQYTTWSTAHIPGIVAIAISTLHDPLHTYLVLLLLPPVHYMIHYTHTWYCCYCHQYTTWSTTHIPGIVAIATSTLHDPLHTYLVLLLLPPVHYMIHYTHTWYCCYCNHALHYPLHTYVCWLYPFGVRYSLLQDLVTVSKEWEIHKQNSRTERALPNSTSGRNHQRSKHTSMSMFGFDTFLVHCIEERMSWTCIGVFW